MPAFTIDPDGGSRGEFGDAVRAPRLSDHDQPGEHRESTASGDEQGLERGRPGTRLVVVVADEEVRRDRGEFPEHEQPDQLIGQDDAEHRAGEDREHAGEAGDTGEFGVVLAAMTAVVRREVAERVDADQQPDARDDGDHEEGERVEPQVDGDVEAAHPGERLGHRLTVDDAAPSRRRPHEHRGRSHRGDREGPASEHPAGGDDGGADDEVKGEQHEHGGRGASSTVRADTNWGAVWAERRSACLANASSLPGDRFQLGGVTRG